MEFSAMYSRAILRNGTAIGAALIAVAGTLDAQRPASTRQRDTAVVVRVFGPGGIPLDSIRSLFKEYDREQIGSQRWIVLRGRIDSLFHAPMLANGTAMFRGVFANTESNRQAWERLGWLGLNTQGPNKQVDLNGELFVTQFAYPLIVSVDPQSPAEKAGITAGDVLVAYNGIDVVNHEFNLNTLLKPESKVSVTVRRDGDAKEYALVVAKAPQRIIERRIAAGMSGDVMLGPGRVEVRDGMRRAVSPSVVTIPGEAIGRRLGSTSPMLAITTSGVFGANVSTVNSELARALNLRAGVLVNDVPEDSPAFRAGLRIGDIIFAVADQPVVSLTELRRALAAARERAVVLQVTSPNQKTRTVTVSVAPSP
jgi:membrane-associated protease RseP (regulator of RpoE activity)